MDRKQAGPLVVLAVLVAIVALGAAVPARNGDPKRTRVQPETKSGPPVSGSGGADAAGGGVPPAANLPNATAEAQVRLANAHILKSVEQVRLAAADSGKDPEVAAKQFLRDEVRNWRFASWYALATKPTELALYRRVSRWWLWQISTGPIYIAPLEVPGSSGLLWQLDQRDYNWNASAWRAVALREPYFREPHITAGQADVLRGLLGETRVEVNERIRVGDHFEDFPTCPLIGIVRADWLVRETMEADRSPSYYDLLFASRRHANNKVSDIEEYTVEETYTDYGASTYWPGGYDSSGYYYKPGNYRSQITRTRKVIRTRPVTRTTAVKDFPRDEDDWDDFFGTKDARRFFDRQKIDVTRGVISVGSRDDPVRGSIVTRNNRVLTFVDTPYGVGMKSIDVGRTTRNSDFIERPTDVALGQKIKGQAFELLNSLPAGGQAGGLFNAERKRQEIAPTTVAHSRAEKRYVDVRTAMSCVICHAPDGGVIEPRNLFKEYLETGVDLNLNDRRFRNQVRAFFLEWEHQLPGWRARYLRLVERATSDTFTGTPALKPAELVAAFVGLRDWYDDPVSIAQAAHELGVPESVLKYAAQKSPSGRDNALRQGVPTPRDTFERDVFLRLSFVLAAQRDVKLFGNR